MNACVCCCNPSLAHVCLTCPSQYGCLLDTAILKAPSIHTGPILVQRMFLAAGVLERQLVLYSRLPLLCCCCWCCCRPRTFACVFMCGVCRALAALARSSMSSDPDDLTLVSQLMAVAATTLDRCDVSQQDHRRMPQQQLLRCWLPVSQQPSSTAYVGRLWGMYLRAVLRSKSPCRCASVDVT